MDDKWALGGMSKTAATPDEAAPVAPVAPTPEPAAQAEPTILAPAPRASRAGPILSFVVGLTAIAAIGSSAWVYTETRRDMARLSTEIAQFRLSLELFNRQQSAAAPTPTGAADPQQVQDLSNRLAVLEQNWRDQPPASAPAALPAIPSAPANASANAADCLPPGTRLLVSAGDQYPVCGVEGAAVDVASVDNGFLTLSDGTVIAAGATIGLPGTKCMIGIMSSGDGGMTGYAEIRVTC